MKVYADDMIIDAEEVYGGFYAYCVEVIKKDGTSITFMGRNEYLDETYEKDAVEAFETLYGTPVDDPDREIEIYLTTAIVRGE